MSTAFILLSMPRLERLEGRRGYEFVGDFSRPYTIEKRLVSDYDHRIHHGLALVLFDEERRRVLHELGVNVEEIAEQRGIVGLVTDAQMRLRGSLEEGQEVNLGTRLYHNRGVFLAFHHQMQTMDSMVALEANVDIAIMDISNPQNSRVVPLPPDLLAHLSPRVN